MTVLHFFSTKHTFCVIGLLLCLSFSIKAAPSDDFVMTVDTTIGFSNPDKSFLIPTTGTGYSYQVDCDNDGILDGTNIIGDFNCTYISPGVYTIRISGAFPRIFFNFSPQAEQVLSIDQWGTGQWTSMSHAFNRCVGMRILATDVPDLSNVTDASFMFRSAGLMNHDVSNWDISNITNMSGMFFLAESFNQDIGNWDTGHVTDMSSMFQGARSFNQNISNWDTSNVTSMSKMFTSADVFNQPIGLWDISNVIDISGMFDGAEAFNQDLNNWDTSNIVSMNFAFEYAKSFNGDISAWDTSQVRGMTGMFSGAEAFNRYIGDWDTSSVLSMSAMFRESSFNQDISNWDTSNVILMDRMFNSASEFNHDISQWNTSNVTTMRHMFTSAFAFNQDLSNWDVSNVTDMTRMFFGARNFNSDLSRWDTSNVEHMDYLFAHSGFDQDISSWNIENVIDIYSIFHTLSVVHYDAILRAWSQQNLQTNQGFVTRSRYCYEEDARTSLIDNFQWHILDYGPLCVFVELSQDSGSTEDIGDNLPRLLILGDVLEDSHITIFDTAAGTATNGADYTMNTSIQIIVPAGSYDGSYEQGIDIPGLSILQDGLFEPDETIILSLRDPRINLSIGDADTDAESNTQVIYTIFGQGTITPMVPTNQKLALITLFLLLVFLSKRHFGVKKSSD